MIQIPFISFRSNFDWVGVSIHKTFHISRHNQVKTPQIHFINQRLDHRRLVAVSTGVYQAGIFSFF